ncbi:hypothetical protein Q3G72_028749 [Acer saccharum]|nr:hypothetical protein Q3G72_028749 [Acer saccharum]
MVLEKAEVLSEEIASRTATLVAMKKIEEVTINEGNTLGVQQSEQVQVYSTGWASSYESRGKPKTALQWDGYT